MTRHFLDLESLGGRSGLVSLLDSADRHLRRRGTVDAPSPLRGRAVALVFEKASTRTRLSLEVAVHELGGHPVVMTAAGSQMARGEPLEDTARVLGRMVHAITFRTSGPERLETMVQYSGKPVLNALTDRSHPMQLLADLMTVRRLHGTLEGLRYAWIGDGNNMANSWIEAAGLLQLELTLACPEGYDPDAQMLETARARGASVTVTRDPKAAAHGAHVISTDVFASMGQEDEQAARLAVFAPFRVSEELVKSAESNVVVLHCLPAHRGEEIDAAVIDGPRSFVWDQAEARLHTAKAALVWALGLDE